MHNTVREAGKAKATLQYDIHKQATYKLYYTSLYNIQQSG